MTDYLFSCICRGISVALLGFSLWLIYRCIYRWLKGPTL